MTVTGRIAAAPGHQVAIALVDQDAANPYYYGQLYDDVSIGVLSVSEWDGTAYVADASQPIATDVHLGDIDLMLSAHTAPRQLDVEGGWPGEPYQTTAPAPGYQGADRIVFPLGGLPLDVRYVAVVTTERSQRAEGEHVLLARGAQPHQVLGELVALDDRQLAVEPGHLALVRPHVDRGLGVADERRVVVAAAQAEQVRPRRRRDALLSGMAIGARTLEHLDAAIPLRLASTSVAPDSA